MAISGELLAEVAASTPRRMLGVGVLASLGVVLLWTAFNTPPATLSLLLLLLVGGVAALFGAVRMWRATEGRLALTTDGLFDPDGKCLAGWEDMDRVDRGMLAFKPSNGFMLTLKSPGARAWRPGLFWQLGRRIGVGGVTAAAQAKAMADLISIRLAERADADTR
ncbi:hypothetical protein [Pseudaestuariivita atlantica]|uniref:Uncharacterized protein n=1 Tax=Pseudaestuariivita atlantica TaxID=1317121 RepID=A0A0L1JLN0_9RHOB|nr:hypothetical protein [Pseudaestuariivita atlantica]KNG92656.1 hypothetical protein ATO11_16725 [Pseudaestuariivita atlantica]